MHARMSCLGAPLFPYALNFELSRFIPPISLIQQAAVPENVTRFWRTALTPFYTRTRASDALFAPVEDPRRKLINESISRLALFFVTLCKSFESRKPLFSVTLSQSFESKKPLSPISPLAFPSPARTFFPSHPIRMVPSRSDSTFISSCCS